MKNWFILLVGLAGGFILGIATSVKPCPTIDLQTVRQDAFEIGWMKQKLCDSGFYSGELCQEVSYEEFKRLFFKYKSLKEA